MTGAFKAIADYNPLSYLVEGLRVLTLNGLTSQAIAQVLIIPIAIGVGSVALSLRQLSKRLAQQ
jgi:ABC-type polysaccharide/polyol phosphate export permease